MDAAPFDRNSDSSKLERLASMLSSRILGGECGWESLDFDEFLSVVRNYLRKRKLKVSTLTKPRSPDFLNHGICVEHNQACAIYHHPSEVEHAVFNMNEGRFYPSWKAQSEGWHTVQAKTRFQLWMLRKFFSVK